MSTFKFWKDQSPAYMSDIYRENRVSYNYGTRIGYCRLELLFRNTDSGQRSLSAIGPKLWNELPLGLKVC